MPHPSPSPVEIAAWAYCAGHRFGIDDEGTLMLIVHGTADPALVTAIEHHYTNIRAMVLAGIKQTLDGYQPALDGLNRQANA